MQYIDVIDDQMGEYEAALAKGIRSDDPASMDPARLSDAALR